MTTYARLLGAPQVRVAETWHDLPQTKASALLIYLAYSGEWVSRDELLYVFYPDSAESPARGSFRQLLAAVRKFPYSEGLETQDTRLRWLIETDVAHFKKAASEEKWPKALEFYKGELLQGFNPHDLSEFNNWLSLERETLHAAWRKASFSFAAELTHSERHSLAVEVLAPLYTADLLDEEVLQMYLEGLYNSQQKTEALATFATFKTMLHQEVGSEPESKTLELVTLMQQDKPLSVRGFIAIKTQTKKEIEPRHNLPVQPTPFVGREHEKARLVDLSADSDCRLITIVASGGMGKTRLAIEVARSRLERFEETCFVSFAAVASPDLMVYTLADALGLSLFGSKPPKEQVLDYLKNKNMLLVLDNLEHLLAGIDFLSEILATSAEIKILATSRERLELQSEHLFDLYGLTVEGSHGSEALQLFAERAKHNRLEFVLEENLQAVTKICQLVGGMPLAIELAASWSRLLSPNEIVKELEGSLDLLSSQSRDLPERHHSMRTVFEGSWQRLSDDEQAALRRLSVFQGGFTNEAARAVAGLDLSILLSLVNKSLVWRETTGRFSQHPLILQYIQQKANHYPEERKQIEEKHGRYYLKLFREKAPDLSTQKSKETLEILNTEFPNLRVAWDWTLREKQVDEIPGFARDLRDFFLASSHGYEGAEAFKQMTLVLDATNPEHQAALGYALIYQAFYECMFDISEATSQIETTQRGLALLEPLKAYPGILQGQITLGDVMREQGDLAKSKEILTSALELARIYGSPQNIGWLLNELVVTTCYMGSFAEASALIESTVKELRELGDPFNLSFALCLSGGYLADNNLLEEGEKLLLEGLELSRKHNVFVEYGLTELARFAYKRGDLTSAETFVTEAYDRASKLSLDYVKAHNLSTWGLVKLAQGHLKVAEQLMVEGLRMAWVGKLIYPISINLVCLAELSMAQGQVKESATLLTFLSHYPYIEKRHHDQVLKLLENARGHLSPRAFTQAQEESKSLTLEGIVTGLLEREMK